MSPETRQAPGAGFREKGDHALVVSTLCGFSSQLKYRFLGKASSICLSSRSRTGSLIVTYNSHSKTQPFDQHLPFLLHWIFHEDSDTEGFVPYWGPSSAPNTASGPKLVLVNYLWDGWMNEWIILEWNHVLLWHCKGLHLRPRGSSLTHHITESCFFKPNFPTDPISSFWWVTRGPVTTSEETSVCMKEAFWRWESSSPGYKSRLQHFLAVWPWVNYFTFLGLSSLVDKVEMTMTLCRFFQWFNEIT